jgi:DNA-binding GntR family transcriptional regulator
MSDSPFVRPVDAVSVADRVTSEIRRAILAGRLRPGQEFSLRHIAGQLGVSFIPVREALRSLEAEGLLITRRGRSATVAPLDPDELHGICQLRRRIEPDLAARACVLTTAADLDVLEAHIALAQDTQSHSDERYDAHRGVLLDLLQPAATSWDLRMLQMLWRATERYLRVGFDLLDRTAGDATRLASAQYALVAAYRAKDPQTARAAMLRHVDWSENIADRGLAAAS